MHVYSQLGETLCGVALPREKENFMTVSTVLVLAPPRLLVGQESISVTRNSPGALGTLKSQLISLTKWLE